MVWATRRLLIRISGMTKAGQLSWNMNKYLEFFVFCVTSSNHLTTVQAIQHLSIVSSLDKTRLTEPYHTLHALKQPIKLSAPRMLSILTIYYLDTKPKGNKLFVLLALVTLMQTPIHLKTHMQIAIR